MGGMQVGNCQLSAVSVMENLCPDISRLLVHTQLEALLCGLHWEAAKLTTVWLLESLYPPVGPEFPPPATLVYAFLIQPIASTHWCSLFGPGVGGVLRTWPSFPSGHGRPSPLDIGIPPCPPASTHSPTQ